MFKFAQNKFWANMYALKTIWIVLKINPYFGKKKTLLIIFNNLEKKMASKILIIFVSK